MISFTRVFLSLLSSLFLCNRSLVLTLRDLIDSDVIGQKVFEWDQTLEEVNLYITLPPNVHSKAFHCKIQSKHLEVGIKGNPPYLNVSSFLCLYTFWLQFSMQLTKVLLIFPARS